MQIKALYQNEFIKIVGLKVPIETFEQIVALHDFKNNWGEHVPMNDLLAQLLRRGVSSIEQSEIDLDNAHAWVDSGDRAHDILEKPYEVNGIWKFD